MKEDGRLLEISLTGKVVKEDYDAFVPAVDRGAVALGWIARAARF